MFSEGAGRAPVTEKSPDSQATLGRQGRPPPTHYYARSTLSSSIVTFTMDDLRIGRLYVHAVVVGIL